MEFLRGSARHTVVLEQKGSELVGTHRGEIMGVAATGRTVQLPGINIFRVVDGKIVERSGTLYMLGYLVQLGVVPQPA